jgi:hypothetical protein
MNYLVWFLETVTIVIGVAWFLGYCLGGFTK